MLRRRAHDPANARRPFRLSTSDTILVIMVFELNAEFDLNKSELFNRNQVLL